MGIVIDTSQIDALSTRLDAVAGPKRDEFFTGCAQTLGNQMLNLVRKATPSRTGVLRRGWSAGEVAHSGNAYTVELINDVNYASYVEYGHRQTPGRYVPAIKKRLVASWVEGKHFLQMSEDDMARVAPGVISARLNAFLRTVI